MNADQFACAVADGDNQWPQIATPSSVPVGVMIRGTGGEWEFLETPKPQLRYDHKSGKPLLILGRVQGTLAKP